MEFPGNNVNGRGSTTSNVGTKGVRVMVGIVIGDSASIKVGVNVNVGCNCVGAAVGVSLGTGVSVGTISGVDVEVASNAIISGMAEQAASIKDRKNTRIFFTNGGFI